MGLQQDNAGAGSAADSGSGGVVWGTGVGVAATAGNAWRYAGGLGDCKWVQGWVCRYPELLYTEVVFSKLSGYCQLMYKKRPGHNICLLHLMLCKICLQQ